MKNLNAFPSSGETRPGFFLALKLAVLIFLVSIVPNYANTTAQIKISLHLKEVTLTKAFEEIEDHTSFSVFYENSKIDLDQKVSVDAENQEIEKVLKLLLRNTQINFEILENQIILTPQTLKSTSSISQDLQQQVVGKVVDPEGVPLYGATVLVNGTSEGTTTNQDGIFSINIPAGTTLTVSFVGFLSQELIVGEKTNLLITLKPDMGELDEVVLVGYGTNERRDIVGSVGVVEMENIQSQAPTVNVDAALQGQIPGVFVASSNGQPGAPAKIRIRGTTSLWGSNQPLYVIDGIPVVPNSNIPVGGTEGFNLGRDLDQRGLNTPIGNINISDIKSISVLKDASAGAIYGSRAANGVIIIETKRGTFGGEPIFNVEVSSTTSTPKTLDVLNADQFKQVTTAAVSNGTIDNAYTQSVLDGSYFGTANTNWEDELSPSAPVTTDFNLNVRGGNANTRYFSSIGANKQAGVFEGVGFDRYSFKLNMDTKVSDIWNFGVRSNLSYTDQMALGGGVTDRMYMFRPDLPVFDETGHYSFSTQYGLENPVALSKASNENKTLLMLASFFAEVELAKGLKAKSLISLNYNNGIQESFYPSFTYVGGWDKWNGDGEGYAQQSRSNYSNLMWENTLRYTTLFANAHELDAVVGASFEQTSNSYLKGWGEGFFNDVLTNLSSATLEKGTSSYKSTSGLSSYFGRVNYNYDSTYLLTLSGRVDGSSKFAVENKYAFFPAAAAGWRISNEDFMSGLEFVNDLKLRSSWGITGQQDFGPYQWRTLFETEDYAGEPAIIMSQLGNDRLKWERTRQFDLGLDFAFLDHRLTGTIGYYLKDTEDAIFPVKTPGNTGFSSVLANIGSTRNRGYEFQLNADLFRGDDFRWNIGFNASTNRNTLTNISEDFKNDDGYVTGFGRGGYLKEGSPIGLIYGYVYEDLFQDQADIDALNAAAPGGTYQEPGTAPGDMRFADISGPEGVPDGMVDSYDQTIIGDTQADFFGGFSNSFNYKGFSLRALFTYSVGNDLHWFNQSRSINFSSTYLGENKTLAVLNAWTPENPTNQPRIVYGDPNNNDRISSYYVYDASYVRLKSLNLQYSFSDALLENVDFVRSVSAYVIGQNLVTFTDYPGADPEASNLYNNDISAGRDNNRYPIAKSFTVGIKVGF